MGKTRDLFKKIRDTKGKFHAKMGTIKDRNSMDITEVENIKRWQEYTELYKRDPDNHDGVTTHPEPDILVCEAKWVLGSITMNKTSGGDGISVELFQILKDDAIKVLHSICQEIGELSSGHTTGEGQYSHEPKEGSNAKECSDFHIRTLILHASKVNLKVLCSHTIEA